MTVSSKADYTIRAIIKTASPENKVARQELKREHEVYHLFELVKSPFFRRKYDVIGDPKNFDDIISKDVPCLALEWMELSLSNLPSANAMHSYPLVKAIVEAVMSSCVALAGQGRVNTGEATVLEAAFLEGGPLLTDSDTKPANILLSNVDSGNPIARIADLGLGMRVSVDLTRAHTNAFLVHPDGSLLFAQPYAMRAPEVYEGRPYVHSSQIWACAAMLLCWMKPGILGAVGSPGGMFNEGWCIAKIRRLFPDWTPLPTEDSIVQAEFEFSDDLIKEPPPDLESISPLEDEMRKINMQPEVRDLLRFLLVIDPGKRPSATEVLASKPYLALVQKAHTSFRREH